MENDSSASQLPDAGADAAKGNESPNQPPVAPATGRGQAFRNVARELIDAELTNPGTVKLLLELLYRSEADAEEFRGFVERYHDANTRAAVLDQRLQTSTTLEVLYTVGVVFGAAIMGLSVSLMDKPAFGIGGLVLGAALLACAIWARASKR